MSDPNKQLLKKLPLVCPFCDELAYQSPRVHRIVTANRIYTLRTCYMGHDIVSVEEIPENQSAVIEEIRAIKKERKLENEREDSA